MKTSPDLSDLLERLDKLIELLEKQNSPKRDPVPAIPDFPPQYPIPKFEEKRTCPTCGITLEQVMGYVCSHQNCPTGLGPIVC